jgi:hypothetical protein
MRKIALTYICSVLPFSVGCILPEVEPAPAAVSPQGSAVSPVIDGSNVSAGAGPVQTSSVVGDPFAAAPDQVCNSLGCSLNAICVERSGVKTCECRSGFIGDGKLCEAVDSPAGDCTTVSCGANATCTMEATGPVCRCSPGYTGDADHCIDIDECLEPSPRCGRNARCENAQGSFICTCEKGWSGDGASCVDIDECTTGRPCGTGASCRNTAGGFACECNPGFDENGMSCVPSDPCEPSPCGPGLCAPMGTSYTCNCAATDFMGTTCNDRIDDCASTPCGRGGECVDGDRSYTCTCKPGYSGTQCQSNVCDTNPCGRKNCDPDTGACMAPCYPNCAGLGEPCEDNGDCESVCCGFEGQDTFDNCLEAYKCAFL